MATKTEPERATRSFLSSDVIAALLAHFPEETFEANPTQLQAAFRCVSHDYPMLLGQLSFGKVGEYVGSATIEAALDSLETTGYYSRCNLDLLTYQLHKEDLLKYYKDFLENRFEESGVSSKTIEEAAKVLRDSLHKIHASSDRKMLMVYE